ncbi:MAG TPA: formate--tetrahydrofolate ligase [Fimbriiglobus sp.]|jgi:formate--tetrahydrofolate ligase
MNDSTPAVPERIDKIVAKLGLPADEVEPCGWFKGKFALGMGARYADKPKGKYVGVTAINPTPLGEGKTATAIGLSMALCRLGHRAVATLRQPSQAPVFGIKGGGAGGGRATLLPFNDINLHFTGDLHAIAAAHNLLAALIDNHLKRGKKPQLDPSSLTWRRVIDVSDKSLAQITTGPGDAIHPLERRTGFDLTAASEIMAIIALATGMEDLKARLARIVVGQTAAGDPVSAEDLGAAGAMAALLRDAVRPNLAQTAEHTPAIVHAGPFGNIAHGNSSVLADLTALPIAEYVITESGFGADCGAEKLFHIKCRASGLSPDVEVLVCTVRGLKLQSGLFQVKPGRPLPPELLAENLDALRTGAVNLQAHLDILRLFGIPVVVAINRFPTDSDRELALLRSIATDQGAETVAVSDVFANGGAGGEELARAVVEACRKPARFRMLYTLEMSAEEKMETLAKRVYGADGIDLAPRAAQQLNRFREIGFGQLPICIAKTQYSLSHDPKLLGRPRGYRFPIRDVRLSAGAGFLYALAGEISTMPGLPAEPKAYRIGLDFDGNITGLT